MKRSKLSEKEKELSKNKSVKIYKRILRGDIREFPDNYWNKCENPKYELSLCVKYMCEILLKWENEEDYKNISRNKLKKYKLDKMLDDIFDGSIIELINYMYPDKYYEWTFLGRSHGYWSKEKLIWAVKHIFEKHGWNKEDICKKYNYKLFIDNGLEYALKKIYKNKIYDLFEDIYHNEDFKLWELKSVPKGYWTKETAINATIWMIKKLNWSRDDIKIRISKAIFKENGLEGMLRVVYNNSVYDAINAVYPGEYKRYEFGVSKGYWTNETAIGAIRDMIDDLGYTRKDICLKLSKEDFKKYKLDYPVQKIFKGSYYDAINAVYPNEYGMYELKNFRYKEIKMNTLAEYIEYYE